MSMRPIRAAVEPDAAFEQLPGYARRRSLKLGDVARRVVTRELDPAVLTADA